MSILGNRVLGGAGQQRYQVGRSLRFRSSASAYLSRTPASATNQTTWTWSAWVKRGKLGSVYQSIFNVGEFFNSGSGATYATGISFSNNDNIVAYWASSVSPVATSAAVFRDPSAWYHIVVRAGSNLLTVYVNNQQVISTSISGNGAVNNNILHYIGSNNNPNYFDGYLAEVNFIDGQTLTPSSFGAYDTNGVWQPKKYTGTYGTNGFYLPFSNTTSTTTLVQDSSGNGNNWTPNNISLTAGTTYDSMIDSPTVSASASNYAVLNPLSYTGTSPVLSSANLNFAASSAAYTLCPATIGVPSSGKWYWETTVTTITTSTNNQDIGVGKYPFSGTNMTLQCIFGVTYTSLAYYYTTPSVSPVNGNASLSAPAQGDIMQVAYDVGTGKVWFGVNNTWILSGNPSTGANPVYTYSDPTNIFPFLRMYNTAGVSSANFGQRPFSYTPPTGFNALNTYNLPAPSIANGAQYMAATTFTGNVSTNVINNGANTILGTSFQPDMVWLKSRSNANNHTLYDSIRGINDILYPNLTNAAVNSANNLTSFNTNGYTLGANENSNDNSGESSVGWSWKAGGTGVTNTSGTITSTVSANPTAGFSIVTYTGTGANATVGHGLGVAPSMILYKARNNTGDWTVGHSNMATSNPWNYVMFLDLTNAAAASSGGFNNTAPTSSVFSIGSAYNPNGWTQVAYCFAAVSGYSAFGSYTGNGSTDGPFVYTGFRPRYVMVKGTGVANWYVWDSSRSTYNVMNETLYPNLSNAEGGSGGIVDFLSNGFKLRTTGTDVNGSGNTIIYAAFSENPFKYSRAR